MYQLDTSAPHCRTVILCDTNVTRWSDGEDSYSSPRHTHTHTHKHTHCQSSLQAQAYLSCLLITIIIVINIILTLTSGDSVTDRQTDLLMC